MLTHPSCSGIQNPTGPKGLYAHASLQLAAVAEGSVSKKIINLSLMKYLFKKSGSPTQALNVNMQGGLATSDFPHKTTH